MNIAISLNLTKVPEGSAFVGKKGEYLERGEIVGNWKYIGTKQPF